jgi:hypothetical protein
MNDEWLVDSERKQKMDGFNHHLFGGYPFHFVYNSINGFADLSMELC